MKKILILLFILSLLWIAKLSYDLFNLTAQQTELNTSLHRIEQNNANLNDQFVALCVMLTGESAPASSQAAENLKTIQAASIDPVVVIKQQLELIEFMLQQQQFTAALDKLTRLDQNLEQYALAAPFEAKFASGHCQNHQLIQHFVGERMAQQVKVDRLIQQLDAALGPGITGSSIKRESGTG